MPSSPQEPSSSSLADLPPSIRVLSLNCWGLKFISKHRQARLQEIGHQLCIASPRPEIVGLQECWTQEDFVAIRELTKEILPFGKFFWSGSFGGGLVILSKWPMEETGMVRFSLNGRPSAFWRGDWFVGKGVASARIRIPGQQQQIGGGGGGGGGGVVVEVFCTHLHAPYEREPNDSYLCHRTAQAWEIAKMMRHARERGNMVLGLGDFNMVPLSLAHRIIEAHGGGVRDVWRVAKPESSLGSAESEVEKARGRGFVPSAKFCLEHDGATCDSKFNTWRWSAQARKDLDRGKDTIVDPEQEDVKAKRLDYIFFGSNQGEWKVEDVKVGMTTRHPTLKCSLSDHFSIETTLVRQKKTTTTTTTTPTQRQQNTTTTPSGIKFLPRETYELIQDMIAQYDLRERKQRKWRIAHFFAQFSISIACLVAVWWSPRNFVSFLLMLLSTLGLSAGVIDGLMGLLFVGSELRALREFKYEIDYAAAQAGKSFRDSRGEDGHDKDELFAREVVSRDDD